MLWQGKKNPFTSKQNKKSKSNPSKAKGEMKPSLDWCNGVSRVGKSLFGCSQKLRRCWRTLPGGERHWDVPRGKRRWLSWAGGTRTGMEGGDSTGGPQGHPNPASSSPNLGQEPSARHPRNVSLPRAMAWLGRGSGRVLRNLREVQMCWDVPVPHPSQENSSGLGFHCSLRPRQLPGRKIPQKHGTGGF